MIVWKSKRKASPGRGRRRIRRLVILTVCLAVPGIAFVAGFFANEDGYSSEFLRVTYQKIRRPFVYAGAILANEELPTLRIEDLTVGGTQG